MLDRRSFLHFTRQRQLESLDAAIGTLHCVVNGTHLEFNTASGTGGLVRGGHIRKPLDIRGCEIALMTPQQQPNRRRTESGANAQHRRRFHMVDRQTHPPHQQPEQTKHDSAQIENRRACCRWTGRWTLTDGTLSVFPESQGQQRDELDVHDDEGPNTIGPHLPLTAHARVVAERRPALPPTIATNGHVLIQCRGGCRAAQWPVDCKP